MESFEIVLHRDLTDPQKVRMELVGSLNEEVHLDPEKLKNLGIVEMDLQKLVRMNSIGIREWTYWIRSAPNLKFTFLACPKFFIQQANTMAGFIPSNTKFISFYVPYYNEELGEEKDFLFLSKNFLTDKPQSFSDLNIPDTILDENGKQFVLDVDKKRYFRFLFETKS